jgi:DNA-binding SARP family transcriptional activator
MALQLRLFGHLQVRHGSQVPVTALRPRAQRLLAYLILHRKHPPPRPYLAFTLWTGESEEHALALLRRALSELRLALPPEGEWVISTRDQVYWNSAADAWIDADEFDHLFRQADLASLSRAVDLYTDDLLLNIDDPWVLPERERFHLMQIEALRLLSTHHRTSNNISAAFGFTRRAIALDPLSEILYRDLIALHALAGDRPAALAEFERLKAELKENLGVEPMPETLALVEDLSKSEPLHSFDPGPRTAAAGSLARGESAPQLTFQIPPKPVGRGNELEKLSTLWDGAARGSGCLAILSGEAGVGKSHLARSLAFQVARSGGLPLTGYCYEFEASLPYQPVVEMLRTVLAQVQGSALPSTYRSTLARLIPEVQDNRELPEPEADPDSLRAILFEAFLQTFLFLAKRRPLLLVFEDVHWADQSTLDWFTYIVPRLSACRIFILVTYRVEAVGMHHALVRLERRFKREGAIAKLPLEPLTRPAYRELVAQLSGLDAPGSEPLADRLFLETGGNPFFLSEMVQSLIETGLITLSGGRWSGAFVEAASETGLPLPESLLETIQARVERLPEMACTFIKTAAVAGRFFRYQTVQRAGGWDSEAVLDALENLLARGFLHANEPPGCYTFAHHLVQEAIYAGLSAPRRAYLHRQIAQAVQAISPDDYRSLAYHYSRAGDEEAARANYLKAGDRAWQMVALKEAAEHYLDALKRWPPADAAGQAETLYKLGQCQWVSAETHSALASLEAARALFEQLGEQVRAGDMERLVGRLYWELGDRATAVLHLQRAITLLNTPPESVELARAVSAISQMHMVASEFDSAIEWGERALQMAERLGAEDVIVHVLNNLGSSKAHVYKFDQERGLDLLRESLRRALAQGLAHDACRAYFNLAEDLAGLCRYGEARALFEELYAYSGRIQALSFPGGAVRRLAALDWSGGHWGAVLGRWEELLKWSADIWGVWAARLIGRIYNDLGRTEIARLELERTLPRVLKWGEIQVIVPHLEQLARACTSLGLEKEAEETIRHYLGLIDRNPYLDWSCTLPLLFACSWFAARPETLGEAWACLPRLERADEQFRTPESGAALAEGRGVVALAGDSPHPAVPHLEGALAGWKAIARPYDQARALVHLGRALSLSAGPTSAKPAYDQALTILNHLADQVENEVLKGSFLNSPLFSEVRAALTGIV